MPLPLHPGKLAITATETCGIAKAASSRDMRDLGEVYRQRGESRVANCLDAAEEVLSDEEENSRSCKRCLHSNEAVYVSLVHGRENDGCRGPHRYVLPISPSDFLCQRALGGMIPDGQHAGRVVINVTADPWSGVVLQNCELGSLRQEVKTGPGEPIVLH